MKFKCFFLFLVTFVLTVSMNAQVTIGRDEVPDTNALLDLKENSDGSSAKGLLPPRVALQSTSSTNPMTSPVKAGMTVYNTATSVDVTPGYYYYDGTKWVRLATDQIKPKFFYMPSIVLPVDPADPCGCYNSGDQKFTVNLHTKYSGQFGTPQAKNPSGPSALPYYVATDLNYYITYFDTAVFTDVAVDNSGVLTYKIVSSPSITEKSYMNIVFEVK